MIRTVDEHMIDYRRESVITSKKYANGTLKRFKKPFRVGIEIEQSAVVDNGGNACEPVLINKNPTGLPKNIPDTVIARSIMFSNGHFDGSRPWEFDLNNSINESILLKNFDRNVKKNWWCWHNEFKDGSDYRGCSAHIHFSVTGPICLGSAYGNQMVATASDWAIMWNNLVTLFPITIPFYVFGSRPRSSGLNEWAKPVYDRFEDKNIIELFTSGTTKAPVSDRVYSTGHEYNCLSWNRHDPKVQITIENRLSEAHPYWIIPVLQALALYNNATIVRGYSLKLVNSYDTLNSYWRHIFEHDVYKALLKMTEVRFVMPDDRKSRRLYRGMPFICNDAVVDQIHGDDRVYPTALDFFRAICRRFMKSGTDSPMRFNKIMRMWSDFIDFSKLPANLIWDIDDLYYQLYESDKRKENQDRYLYFGSSVIGNNDRKSSKPVSEMI